MVAVVLQEKWLCKRSGSARGVVAVVLQEKWFCKRSCSGSARGVEWFCKDEKCVAS